MGENQSKANELSGISSNIIVLIFAAVCLKAGHIGVFDRYLLGHLQLTTPSSGTK